MTHQTKLEFSFFFSTQDPEFHSLEVSDFELPFFIVEVSLSLRLSVLWTTYLLGIVINVVDGFMSGSVESSRITALTESLFVVGLCTVRFRQRFRYSKYCCRNKYCKCLRSFSQYTSETVFSTVSFFFATCSQICAQLYFARYCVRHRLSFFASGLSITVDLSSPRYSSH